tara:strand:+ start:148 stop:579 length:432 start_codon:yes stop_codon:yes gene_type:complete
MKRTLTKSKTRKSKTRKNKKSKTKQDIVIGFDNIPKTKRILWLPDKFGKRKLIHIEKHVMRKHIDNNGLATDFKNNSEKFKLAKDEFKRRIIIQLKNNKKSRKIFEKKVNKTLRRYNSKTIEKLLNKLKIHTIQNLYREMLKN